MFICIPDLRRFSCLKLLMFNRKKRRNDWANDWLFRIVYIGPKKINLLFVHKKNFLNLNFRWWPFCFYLNLRRHSWVFWVYWPIRNIVYRSFWIWLVASHVTAIGYIWTKHTSNVSFVRQCDDTAGWTVSERVGGGSSVKRTSSAAGTRYSMPEVRDLVPSTQSASIQQQR